MTPEQLRASILQYAMEGKLVKQNSNDEPVSELIKRIESERDELIKEGKIKKSKKLPAVTDDEKLFDIPDNWKWVRVGDIVIETIGGGTPSKTEPEYWNGNIPWISVKDIHDGDLEITNAQDSITEKGMNNSSTNLVKAGVLIAVMRMAVGRIATLKIDACINQDLRALITSKYFFDKYLLYMYSQLNLETSGMTVKGLKINNLLNAVLPLPPLEEQKRIVAKIEKLMPLVDEYAESYNRLQKIDNEFEDKLKQSVLQYAMEGKLVKQDPSDEPASELIKKIKNEKAELIKEGKIKKSKKLPVITDDEKPFDIPDSWEWIRLGDYAEKITDEVASGSFAAIRDNVRKYKTENYAIMVKTADFANHFSKNLTYTDEHGYNFLNNSNLFGGELILSNIGSIGKCFIVPKLNRPMTLAPNSIMTKLIDPKLNKFLYYFIKSPIGNFELLQIASGTTMKKFNKTNLKGILIPIPPLNEQKRIVFEIEKIVNSIDKLSK